MERIEAIVIGAGVVGLAIARALARSGRSVVILEREGLLGTATSSRNSEVIHAGFHYPHDSLRERLCIGGKNLLYAWCEERGVPHRRIGKLTLASDEADLPRLEAIAAHAFASRADEGLVWLDPGAARAIEPALACAAALLSPSSGIIDSAAYMLSLLGDAEDHGAVLARHARAGPIEQAGEVWRVHVDETVIEAAIVVNAAGLDAWEVARGIAALDPARIPPRFLAKGSYFTYARPVPFGRLIYPLPIKGGLGTHLTFDLGGRARFGPDVEWVDAVDYTVNAARRSQFLGSVKRFWPAVAAEHLHPGYSGIRPKLAGLGDPDEDFRIEGSADHGLPGLVNLFGIDSPGLTASLAIGAHVAALCCD